MYESITVIAPLVLTGIDSKAPCRCDIHPSAVFKEIVVFFYLLWCFLCWFIHLNWSDLEKVVLGHELVDGLEPVVRGVGVPAYGQQQGVLVSYPGHLKINILY
jgi:hypothetical protein